jgi:hypothetical protein
MAVGSPENEPQVDNEGQELEDIDVEPGGFFDGSIQ